MDVSFFIFILYYLLLFIYLFIYLSSFIIFIISYFFYWTCLSVNFYHGPCRLFPSCNSRFTIYSFSEISNLKQSKTLLNCIEFKVLFINFRPVNEPISDERVSNTLIHLIFAQLQISSIFFSRIQFSRAPISRTFIFRAPLQG